MRTKALLPIAVAVLLAGCSSQMEREFKAGCRSSGLPGSMCACIFDKLEPDLKRVEKNMNYMNSSAFQSAYLTAVLACKPN